MKVLSVMSQKDEYGITCTEPRLVIEMCAERSTCSRSYVRMLACVCVCVCAHNSRGMPPCISPKINKSNVEIANYKLSVFNWFCLRPLR